MFIDVCYYFFYNNRNPLPNYQKIAFNRIIVLTSNEI